MGFFDKIRASFARFMSGRYGIDNLGHEMVIAALVMTVVGALSGFSLLTLMADALILLALFLIVMNVILFRTQIFGRKKTKV